MSTTATVIFDNGGGVTLQLGTSYAHYYENNAKRAAMDAMEYLRTGNTNGWEGHEEEATEAPSDEAQNNGGYRVMSFGSIAELQKETWENFNWDNQKRFFSVVQAAGE